MENYNDEYYIVDLTRDKDRIYAKICSKSARRGFGSKKLIRGGEPIFFENAHSKVEKKAGIKHQIPDIILEAGDLIVNEKIRDFLKMYDTDGMQLYPAIYVDDDDEWHEKFWCLNFYESLDCWDRELSEVRESPPMPADLMLDTDTDEEDDSYILKYSLDAKVLDAIPEERRLVFKMGKTMRPIVVVHQRVADFLNQMNATGIRLFRVSEFEEGMQFR